MDVWINRLCLALLIGALVHLQVGATRSGRGWNHLVISGAGLVMGVLFLSVLDWDYLGQIGRMLFITFCVGVLTTRSPSRSLGSASGEEAT